MVFVEMSKRKDRANRKTNPIVIDEYCPAPRQRNIIATSIAIIRIIHNSINPGGIYGSLVFSRFFR